MKKQLFSIFVALTCTTYLMAQISFEPYINFPIKESLVEHVITGDFNSDGKKDMAVATEFNFDSNDYKLFVYL